MHPPLGRRPGREREGRQPERRYAGYGSCVPAPMTPAILSAAIPILGAEDSILWPGLQHSAFRQECNLARKHDAGSRNFSSYDIPALELHEGLLVAGWPLN